MRKRGRLYLWTFQPELLNLLHQPPPTTHFPPAPPPPADSTPVFSFSYAIAIRIGAQILEIAVLINYLTESLK